MASGSTMQTVQEKLREPAGAIRRCRRCPLHKQRLYAVPGEGSLKARIVVIGEAPGPMDRTGRPFVGPAGRFLDQFAMRTTFQNYLLTSGISRIKDGVPRT